MLLLTFCEQLMRRIKQSEVRDEISAYGLRKRHMSPVLMEIFSLNVNEGLEVTLEDWRNSGYTRSLDQILTSIYGRRKYAEKNGHPHGKYVFTSRMSKEGDKVIIVRIK